MDNESKVISVSEYLCQVFQKIKSADKEGSSQIFWFRGEGSINWDTPLVPNIYRVIAHTFRTIEDDFFDSRHLKHVEGIIHSDFYRQSLPFLMDKGIENTGWNRYFLMQHYNIPTRLLDWTENALLALFFAVDDKSTQKDDARVWILQPFILNNMTINSLLGSEKNFRLIPHGLELLEPNNLTDSEGKIFIDELTRRYLKMEFTHLVSEPQTNIYQPLAIYPLFLDQRMVAQKTCFTVFGNKINGLISNTKKDEFLDSILIDGTKKKQILNELSLVGFDHSSIFPDLDGLGKSLNKKYEHSIQDNRETLIHVFQGVQTKINKPSS
jgi:hypothetical protein